jgi:hypothetical protein
MNDTNITSTVDQRDEQSSGTAPGRERRARRRNQNAASEQASMRNNSSGEVGREEGSSVLLEPTIDNDDRAVSDDIEEGTALTAVAAPDRERRARNQMQHAKQCLCCKWRVENFEGKGRFR